MKVQSIIFDDKLFDTNTARKWLNKNEYIPIKRVHHTENYLRYRIRQPDIFKSFITKEISPGIKIVFGV